MCLGEQRREGTYCPQGGVTQRAASLNRLLLWVSFPLTRGNTWGHLDEGASGPHLASQGFGYKHRSG